MDKILLTKKSVAVYSDGTGFEQILMHKSSLPQLVIMTDDVDGAHIRTLLLTLIYRFMRPVLEVDTYILHNHHLRC